jgi:hypothetical protein
MVPLERRQIFAEDVKTAELFAAKGRFALGYDLLLDDRDRTYPAMNAGQIWAAALLTAYRQVIEQYERTHGVRFR